MSNYFDLLFFKCRPRPTVMYIIVIYRQPCALHISCTPYTTPHGEFTVARVDTVVFRE